MQTQRTHNSVFIKKILIAIDGEDLVKHHLLNKINYGTYEVLYKNKMSECDVLILDQIGISVGDEHKKYVNMNSPWPWKRVCKIMTGVVCKSVGIRIRVSFYGFFALFRTVDCA